MKVKIHLNLFGIDGLANMVYLIKYANGDVKIVNCSYFFNPEIIKKFDKTEILIKRYYLSVLKQNKVI